MYEKNDTPYFDSFVIFEFRKRGKNVFNSFRQSKVQTFQIVLYDTNEDTISKMVHEYSSDDYLHTNNPYGISDNRHTKNKISLRCYACGARTSFLFSAIVFARKTNENKNSPPNERARF